MREFKVTNERNKMLQLKSTCIMPNEILLFKTSDFVHSTMRHCSLTSR